MIDQVEQSLRRLQTDYLDLLWTHDWDRFAPVDETLRVLDDLVRDGKVRYLGFSDVPAWVASETQTLARLRGWSPITDELCAVADELGASPAATAIAWVQQRVGVTATLIGARTLEQLKSNLSALDITFAQQQLDRLNAVSAPSLDFPAMYAGYTGMAQFAGATVDGQTHDINPPLLTSTTRY